MTHLKKLPGSFLKGEVTKEFPLSLPSTGRQSQELRVRASREPNCRVAGAENQVSVAVTVPNDLSLRSACTPLCEVQNGVAISLRGERQAVLGS